MIRSLFLMFSLVFSATFSMAQNQVYPPGCFGINRYDSATGQVIPPPCAGGPQGIGQGQRIVATTVHQGGIPTNAIMPPQGAVVPQGAVAPQGYCSWSDRFANIGLSALAGAVIGVLAKDNSEGARQGAALGASVGVFVPCPQQQTPPQRTTQSEALGACGSLGGKFVTKAVCDVADRQAGRNP
ncbi:MAG: hypothetical protein RI935_171 [Candidatus Parcubacteria bacterium]|jgi:hypothetical protein